MLRLITILISLVAHAGLGWALVADYTGSSQRIESFYEGTGDDELKIESTINIKGLATLGDAIETVRSSDMEPQRARQAIAAEQVEIVEPVDPIEDVVEVLTANAVPQPESLREIDEKPEELKPVEQKVTPQHALAEQVVIQEMVAEIGKVQSGGDVTLRNKHLGKIGQHIKKYVLDPGTSVTATTVVQFKVSEDGKLVWHKILESSGSKRLDKAALDSIGRAAPFPPFPEGSIMEAQVLRMPIKFKTR